MEISTVAPTLPATQVVTLFKDGRVDQVNAFLASVPCELSYGSVEAHVLSRRLSHHPQFEYLYNGLPTKWEQGIFFSNMPLLRTRVSISYVEHPRWLSRPIDFSYYVYDQSGNVVAWQKDTISLRQTKTFDLSLILEKNLHVKYGMFVLQTAEKELGSLRIYAYWHNENSVTTTHEKKALINSMPYLVYPTVVVDEDHETYLAISNIRAEPMNAVSHLMNSQKMIHSDSVTFSIKGRSTGFFPVSTLYRGCSTFLKDGAGAIHVRQDESRAMYYYFIHNRRLGSWQIQHL